MLDDESVFKALSDVARRTLLDLLFERDGQNLTELERRFDMSRYGIMKHLKVLVDAQLVVARKSGRRTLHFLNPIPIRQIYERWMHKYAELWAGHLLDLKRSLEEADMAGELMHVYELYIRATPTKLWEAITTGAMTKKYFHETRIESTWNPGEPVVYYNSDDSVAVEGVVKTCKPFTGLSYTWNVKYDPERADEQPPLVTWEIEQMGDTCKLTLEHSFEEESKTYREVAHGWNAIISSMKTLIETGKALDIAS